MYKYLIGDKTYVQKPLVLGQIRQLTERLKTLSLPKSKDVFDIVRVLGDQLPTGLAIVLTEEGKSPKDKNIEETAKEIEFEIDMETVAKVIEDFFVCTPIISILERMGAATSKAGMEIRLKRSQSFSPEETSLSETPSSGDLPRPNAPDSQNIESEI